MPEDQLGKTESKVALRGPAAAKATLERLQKKGILPVKPEAGSSKAHTPPFVPEASAKETYDPARKLFAQEPEINSKIVESYGGEDTIPADIKKELTAEARKLNTMAMGTGESSETEQPVKTAPFSEMPTDQDSPVAETPGFTPPHLEAKGGSAFLKKALEANKPPEPRTGLPPSVFRVPQEAKLPAFMEPKEKTPPARTAPLSTRPPLPEQALREEYLETAPKPPKPSFLSNLFNKLRGRG